ncbi:hypothetical protein HYC85_025812 [Camellia sinensis]|uniref:Uncharacterized protein n=1 Tax=Camellia sinensis TaxID=4442 RepID=A0A7J7GG29_CAMSI|nr:hypothetical protein HYC85_025812 [Camellia sinensis]
MFYIRVNGAIALLNRDGHRLGLAWIFNNLTRSLSYWEWDKSRGDGMGLERERD